MSGAVGTRPEDYFECAIARYEDKIKASGRPETHPSNRHLRTRIGILKRAKELAESKYGNIQTPTQRVKRVRKEP